MSEDLEIRPALPSDLALILSLIREIAEFENLAHEVIATEEGMSEYLFGERPVAEVLIAEIGGDPVGFALFYQNFSTFVGRPGIHLEDIFVREQARGRGVGKALLIEVARIAYERQCGRLEWNVLDWNSSAIAFYESLGAKIHSEWKMTRMDAKAIANLLD